MCGPCTPLRIESSSTVGSGPEHVKNNMLMHGSRSIPEITGQARRVTVRHTRTRWRYLLRGPAGRVCEDHLCLDAFLPSGMLAVREAIP